MFILERLRAMRPGIILKKEDITDRWATGVDLEGVDPGTFGIRAQPRAIDVLREGEYKAIE
jgi:hypothetical protein